MKKQINIAWALPILMLSLSFLHLPYGYYTLLKITVTGCAGYLAFLEYKRKEDLSLFLVLLISLAVLFNPVIPVYFSKNLWAGLDIFAILVFGAYAMVSRNFVKPN